MPFIAFLGCDGSGKSAVIAAVSEQSRATGLMVSHGHWRPVAFGDSGKGPERRSADDPHGRNPRGFFPSVLKLFWLGLNWWVGWFRFLRRQARSGLLIFDRYHADLIVDPRRYRYGGPMWLARLVCQCLPQPDIVFYLDAPPEILLSRKNEVPKAALERSRAAYLRLAGESRIIHVIDAARPLDEVVEDVLGRIHQKGGR
jgi:thymidylate kinase